MTAALRAMRLWTALGWLMVFGLVTLSLIRLGPAPPLPGGDKLGHLLAYGVVMYWWGMVQPARKRHWAAFLTLLGLALELAQFCTGYRQLEWRDAAANLAGVLLALMVLRTPARGLLHRWDRHLADRADPGLP